MLRAFWKLMAGAILSLSLMATSAHALGVQQIGSFEEPTYVTSDPGNPERLFVVERGGTVVVVQNGELKTFADISGVVSCCGGERGLLSIALGPDFDLSGRFYLDYTGSEGKLHVAEMVASGNSAPPSTLRDAIEPIPFSETSSAYGGQLQFGPDGALYVSTGDGGGGGELENAQDPGSELGKILRLGPVPGAVVTPSVWSLGLHDPARFSFDRLTGGLWIGDVGQSRREEVDFAAPPALGQGADYGWDCMEGSIPGPATDQPECAENAGTFVSPDFEYTHAQVGSTGARACAIVGGYVARGSNLSELYGRYLYGDRCTGDIRSFSPASPATTDRFEGLHIGALDSFGQDACGRLYVVSGYGPVYRLVGPGGGSCAATAPPAPVYAPAPIASYVGIRAFGRKVKRHRRGLLIAWARPCKKSRHGEAISLWRGRARLQTRHLNLACAVRFRPRVDRRSGFRVMTKGDGGYLSATSRKVTLLPVRRLRHIWPQLHRRVR